MKRISFLILGLVLSLSIPAFAQIKLDKYQVRADVTAGEVVRGTIAVENISNEGIIVKVYPQDFVFLQPFDGRKEVRDLGSTSYSCGQWITTSLNSFAIPPKGKQNIDYTIKVPEAKKGGYYAVLFFERTAAAGKGAAESGLGIMLRIGCSFYLETKDKKKEIKVEDVAAIEGGIKGKFLNSGDVTLISDSSYYVMDEKGTIFNKGPVRKKFYLPSAESVPFSINIDKNLSRGNYTLVINFNLEGGGSLVKEIDFLKEKSGNIGTLKVKDQ